MPRNTTREMQDPANALMFLADAMGRSSRGENPSDAILDMEARGQRELIRESTNPCVQSLPRDGMVKEIADGCGITIFADDDDPKADTDKLFLQVQLPKGWKIVPTAHSMWSKLVDQNGSERAAIFYKAAFYDRSAHMSWSCRFIVKREPEDRYETDQSYEDRQKGNWYHRVYDQKFNRVIREIKYRQPSQSAVKTPEATRKYYHDTEELEKGHAKTLSEWLSSFAPDYAKPQMYWDKDMAIPA